MLVERFWRRSRRLPSCALRSIESVGRPALAAVSGRLCRKLDEEAVARCSDVRFGCKLSGRKHAEVRGASIVFKSPACSHRGDTDSWVRRQSTLRLSCQRPLKAWRCVETESVACTRKRPARKWLTFKSASLAPLSRRRLASPSSAARSPSLSGLYAGRTEAAIVRPGRPTTRCPTVLGGESGLARDSWMRSFESWKLTFSLTAV
jgi:hypothetical protein